MVLEALPPTYAQAPAAFREFIKTWGTNVVTQCKVGGVVEMRSQWPTSKLHDGTWSTDFLNTQANIDFTRQTHIPDQTGTLDATYESLVSPHVTFSTRGGRAALSSNPQEWITSVPGNPQLISFQSHPIDFFIKVS
jgi:hypothetical protein